MSDTKKNIKTESYIIIPVKTISKKKDPCSQINKYVNKYNPKNKRYYQSSVDNGNYTYLNDGKYNDQWRRFF